MNTPTPSSAPLSEKELADIIWRHKSYEENRPRAPSDSDYMKAFSFHIAQGRLLATLTAKDDIIAGLMAERDAQYDETVNQIHQVGLAVIRAETAESRVKVLEEALRPFAIYGQCLGPIMDQMSNPISISTSRGQAQVTPADFIAACESLIPSDQVERA